MTTLVPRPPYSQHELDQLYPQTLKLQLVQIVGAIVLSQSSPIQSLLNRERPDSSMPVYLGLFSFSDMVISSLSTFNVVFSKIEFLGERSPVSGRFQNVCIDTTLLQSW